MDWLNRLLVNQFLNRIISIIFGFSGRCFRKIIRVDGLLLVLTLICVIC